MKPIVSTALCGLALSSLLGLGACTKPTDATAENFTAAMNVYLASHGDLCVAKNDWPIDLFQQEIEGHTRNAVQMPVLEKLGLVASSDAQADSKDDDGNVHRANVRRYELTDAGKQYYLLRDEVRRDGKPVQQHDLCAAKLSLDKVVEWKPSPKPTTAITTTVGAAPADTLMVVSYTYKAEPAPWMKDADAQKVFPVVANVVRSAGTAQLTQTFRLTSTGWVPAGL